MKNDVYKRGAVFFAAVLLVAAVGCQSKKSGGLLEPKITAMESAYDFGRVKQDQELEHVFKFKNEGKGAMIIRKARGSRGFKAELITTAAVPPGGVAEVKAIFKTKSRLGKKSGKITVESNDKANPELSVAVEADVYADVAVKPRVVSFGRMGKDEKATKELSITVDDPEKIKIKSVKSKDPRFTVNIKQDLTNGTATYEVAFVGSDKIERIKDEIVVDYEGGDETSLEIPCTVTLEGDLRYPRTVYFTRKGGLFGPREISMNSRSGKTVEVKSVEDEAGKLKTAIKTAKGKNAVVVAEVANPNETYAGKKRYILKIHTTDDEQPIVEIGYKISEKEMKSRKSRSKKIRKSRRSAGWSDRR